MMDGARELSEKIPLEDAVGQTLLPAGRKYSAEEWKKLIHESRLGGIFV